MAEGSGLASVAYRTIFRRFSSIVLVGACTVFFFEYTMNVSVNAYWDNHNKGKIWKDVKKELNL